MSNNQNILLMFSGGKDSFLSACRLHYMYPDSDIYLITYDNGCMRALENVESMVKKLKSKLYHIEYAGTRFTYGIAREFYFPYFNMKPMEQENLYPGLTPSQFHCLICKTSMYLYSIWYAKEHDISIIAEGGRKCKKFAIELPGMINRFSTLVNDASLETIYPVYNVINDWDLDNELMRMGFTPKVSEPKCLIGCPDYDSIDAHVIGGVHSYYDKEILPRIKELDLLNPNVYKNYL